MIKKIIDCSKPVGHPDHVRTEDIVGKERDELLASSAEIEARALEPKPKTLEERMDAMEVKIEKAYPKTEKGE